jgi:dolichyl-phosphate-mannose-protein mannosyltransferase
MADPPRLPSRARYVRWLREHPDAIALAFLAAGALVRVRQWLFPRSLWHDEAMLALNVMRRTVAELLGPLDYHQLAPPGYLWVVKGVVATAGPGELPLRLVSLLAGIAMMVAAWRIAWRIYGAWAGAMSAATLALAPGAIYYSNEVKPYACDGLVAALLILMGLRYLDEPLSPRRVLVLACAGSLALWTSYTAPFVLAGLGLSLAIASWQRRGEFASLARLALPAIAWVATWGVVYHLARQGPTLAYMQEYWSDHFMPAPSTPNHAATAMRMTLNLVVAPFESPLDAFGSAERLTALALALSLIGAWALARRRSPAVLCLLVFPPVTLWLASVARLYPVDGRLLLFLLPAIVTLLGGGVELIAAQGAAAPALLAAAVMLSWPAIGAVQTLRHPDEREDSLTLLRVLATEARPADIVYVWRGLDATLDYYRATRPELWPSDVRIVLGTNQSSSAETSLSEINALCRHPRVWLLATHPLPTDMYRRVTSDLEARRDGVVVRAAQSELTLLKLHCEASP